MTLTSVNPQAVSQALEQICANPKVLNLLKDYQMLPKLLQEMIVDQAIAGFDTTPAEDTRIAHNFFIQRQIQTPVEQQQWLAAQGITLKDLLTPLQRELRIAKFKQATWGHKVESYFLKRKATLDQVIYSMIQHQDSNLITELFFRLQEEETTFAELAPHYAPGMAAKTKGIVGPIEFEKLPSNLAETLYRSQPLTLIHTRIGDWYIVAQVEVKVPAQLDEPMRQRLLNELYSEWLQQEINHIRFAA
jgi:parvulin-like peptidyl-prolyl isomerase